MKLLSGILCLVLFQGGAPPSAPVVVAEVLWQPVPRSVTLPGTLIPPRRSRLAAGHEGRLLEWLVQEGDTVIAGQILARLDTRELEGQLAAAQADMDLLLIRQQQAATRLKRTEELHQKSRLSDEALDDARFEAEALGAEVARAQARRDELAARLEAAVPRCPFNGRITVLYREIGEWVGRGENLVEVIEIHPLEVRLALPERHVHDIEFRSPVVLTLTGGTVCQGRVIASMPELDSLTRTLVLKVQVDNLAGQLAPGMTLTAEIALKPGPQALLVPKDAISKKGLQAFVYVVRDNTAQMQPVEVTGYSRDLALVRAPLEAGELVVVRGNERLYPGQPVTIQTPEAP